MAQVSLDTDGIRKLPHDKRLEKLDDILKTSEDESERWDAVWMLGELAEETGLKGPIFEKSGELLAWSLIHDPNSVVRHEISYQIAGRGYHKHVPELIESALHDPSPLVRHESCECLSIIHALDSKPYVEKLLDDPVEIVRDTAKFVLKRMERTKDKEYDRMLSSF